jgi:hypothetical protein
VGSGVLCGSVQRIYLVNQNTVKSVTSCEFAVGRQTHQRSSQTAVPCGGVGGRRAPIVVSHCLAILSEL